MELETETPRARSSFLKIALVGCAAILVVTSAALTATLHSQVVITGTPRAAAESDRSDQDQIRDVLQTISDAYNRKDVHGAQDSLCSRSRRLWNPQLERVWMSYRLRHGAMDFTIQRVDVNGVEAHVTGMQDYANDARPQPFTAEMGRSPSGWRMCSSS